MGTIYTADYGAHPSETPEHNGAVAARCIDLAQEAGDVVCLSPGQYDMSKYPVRKSVSVVGDNPARPAPTLTRLAHAMRKTMGY